MKRSLKSLLIIAVLLLILSVASASMMKSMGTLTEPGSTTALPNGGYEGETTYIVTLHSFDSTDSIKVLIEGTYNRVAWGSLDDEGDTLLFTSLSDSVNFIVYKYTIPETRLTWLSWIDATVSVDVRVQLTDK